MATFQKKPVKVGHYVYEGMHRMFTTNLKLGGWMTKTQRLNGQAKGLKSVKPSRHKQRPFHSMTAKGQQTLPKVAKHPIGEWRMTKTRLIH